MRRVRPLSPTCGNVWRLLILAIGWLAATPVAPADTTSTGPSPRAQATPQGTLRAVEVGATVRQLVEADWIDQDQRFGKPLIASAPARPVTTAEDAAGGCDGVKTGSYGFHTASAERDPWWQVDLGQIYKLDRVVVFNRTDANTAPRTRNLQILVSDGPGKPFRQVYQHDGQVFFGVKENKPLVVSFRQKDVAARLVRLAVPGTCSFALDEVEVYPADAPDKNIARNKKAQAPGEAGGAQPAGEQPFSLAHLETVLDRAERLAQRLRNLASPERLDPLVQELRPLQRRLSAMKSAGQAPVEARRVLYFDARRLLRRIAFTNPRLAIEKLLFLKRHDSAGVYHMCDQYYGCNAVPGGGLFVLVDPFSDNPKLIDLLENSVVEKGRLAGQKLQGGAFLSPEVSFDGQTILFAYTQAKAYARSQGKETYLWGPEISHHIFRVNADGTHLVQLTDGDWDDFDPCYLPNGRVVFISLRRGGYLRCGRHCPVYTMFSMKDDGSDMICLSFHETHEWHPSVTNDGMIVYTRWDYVDRDTNIAHHIWTCFPDGRDPRSFHGNYPVRRESRPWMEMAIRAIPGSHKFVASTGAHHGHEFGSLVLIDPRIPDDGAMSQLERLTPEVPFPEAEGRPIARYACYGTPWPLSEDDYLCVYDAAAKNRGIYWIDRDGNQELIYRDPAISCVSPMPLAPRPRPPILPEATVQTAVRKGASQVALEGLQGALEKAGAKAVAPLVMKEASGKARQAILAALSSKVAVDVTVPTRWLFGRFQSLGLGRRVFRALTGLEARVFMRSDRRVVFDVAKLFPENSPFRTVLQETAVNTGFDAVANTASFEAVARGLSQAGADSAATSAKQLKAWREHLSAWWSAVHTGALDAALNKGPRPADPR